MLTVLAVDDDPAILGIVQTILESAGYRVLTAESAEQALQVFVQAAGAVDVLLSDIEMPGKLNGEDLARVIWQADPRIRVLLMSGRPAAYTPQWRLLPKPFHVETLLTAVAG